MINTKTSKLAVAGFAAMTLAFIVTTPAKAVDGVNLNSSQLSDLRAAAGDVQIPAATPAVSSSVTARAASGAPKSWTVMVYLDAKNSLSNFADPYVSALEKVGSTANMNVVVEEGKLHQGSKRLFINKSAGGASKSQVISSDMNSDMGDYKHAIDFVKWAKTSYPAKHYMFVMWNHGGGWVDPIPQAYFPASKSAISVKSISIDEDAKDYIRTPQLGEILRQAGPVDVFNLYACLMQMGEVAYEVKDNAGVIVASEETMAASQYYYNGVISYITANPDASPAAVGKVIVDAWQNYMTSIPQLAQIPGTMSTVDPKALADLPAKLDAFSSAVMNANDTDAVNYALQNVLRFESFDGVEEDSIYGDLYDFASLVSSQSKDPAVLSSSSDLMDYITGTLVLSNIGLHVDKSGQDYSRARGIAIDLTMKNRAPKYQLSKIMETKYSDLALGKASHWADFVAWTDKAWAEAATK